MAETNRRMLVLLTENIIQLTEAQQRVNTNIRDVIWLLDKVVDRIAKTEQRHAEQDERFNILLQEIRASNRHIDNLEAQ